MRIPSRARSRSMAVDMAPAIGVMFLLVFFFLVASILSRQEATVPLDLPIASTGEAPASGDVPVATLSVLADRSLSLAGNPVAVEDLTERLRELRVESGGDVQIRIRIDRELPYDAFEPALVACAKAEIGDVRLSVLREEESP